MTIDLTAGPSTLEIADRAMELYRELTAQAIGFVAAERELAHAEQACGEIRDRVPPGVLPPPGVRKELEGALLSSRRAFDRLKRAEATWKETARRIVAELEKAGARIQK